MYMSSGVPESGERTEEISEGKTVNKESDYKQEEVQKSSAITQLLKALKLIKNIIKK